LLVERGEEGSCGGNGGDSPLHRASASGNLAIVRFLFKKGANTKSKTPDGQTPLDLAREKGHRAVVDLLTPPPPAPVKTPQQSKGNSDCCDDDCCKCILGTCCCLAVVLGAVLLAEASQPQQPLQVPQVDLWSNIPLTSNNPPPVMTTNFLNQPNPYLQTPMMPNAMDRGGDDPAIALASAQMAKKMVQQQEKLTQSMREQRSNIVNQNSAQAARIMQQTGNNGGLAGVFSTLRDQQTQDTWDRIDDLAFGVGEGNFQQTTRTVSNL
jgi:Ankyrin repeats (many copies)